MKMFHDRRQVAFFVGTILLITSRVAGQEGGGTGTGKGIWLPILQKHAGQYVITDGNGSAASANGRLRQMQAIARDFSASSTHETAGRNELRLMPRPLYRYQPKDPKLIDGALFCLAHGTDPEIFILLEARRNNSGAPVWQYALARFSDLPLNARFKGKELYDVPKGIMNAQGNAHAYCVGGMPRCYDFFVSEEFR